MQKIANDYKPWIAKLPDYCKGLRKVTDYAGTDRSIWIDQAGDKYYISPTLANKINNMPSQLVMF